MRPICEVKKSSNLFELQSGHVQISYFGEKYAAVAVDPRVNVEIDLSPGANQQFVTRPDHIICRDRDALDGRKCRRHIVKQVSAVNWKHVSQRLCHKLLEVGEFQSLGSWLCYPLLTFRDAFCRGFGLLGRLNLRGGRSSWYRRYGRLRGTGSSADAWRSVVCLRHPHRCKQAKEQEN